jgi:hypothetical protein
MKEEVVLMDNRDKNTKPDAPVSVNTQMFIGVVVVGFVMIRVNAKLNIVMRNQKNLADGMRYLGDGMQTLDKDQLTVREVIDFVAKTTGEIVEGVES